MRILVTGGAGFIGSVTAALLLEQDHEVEVLDDLSTGHREAVPGPARLHVGSLHDGGLLDRVFARPFDAVVHFAAFSQVGESVRDPLRYWRNNVGGTIALLARVARGGAGRFVFSSSAAVYGEPPLVPIGEDAPLCPVNPYGRTKLAMEQAIADAAAAAGFAAVALRYFNAAGAWDGRGEDHDPETHLIPRLLRSLLVPGETFAVYGDDYPTPDGTCVRDYIHVRDLAEAHALALAWADGPGVTALNLGTGDGHSVHDIVRAAGRVTGRVVAPPVQPRRPGDPARLVAANRRARDLLGWRPRRSDVDTLLADAWAWHSAHPRGYAG
ncbi:MAG TPA: UDP-glucose 4-epimerase GalE [Candidatus Krumholzibacteria bacterium]|nr:UDP-glucose 4-epimerase GalE [Candidatus Krumholzibacteria bacterium]HPD71085.1 UDP-glucose 4-epimerase GalE [Candidatus Krumholzibacteria bacterium]HRY39215.1 UDP-glucose 4-epimerase GalE [Candidatus Krumholzibacteria bacterium]